MTDSVPPLVVARVNRDIFTEEALQAQDGKTCALRMGNTGPVIGVAIMKYDPHTKALMADLEIDDENVADFLRDSNPPGIYKES